MKTHESDIREDPQPLNNNGKKKKNPRKQGKGIDLWVQTTIP